MTRQEHLLAEEEIALLNRSHATCAIEQGIHDRHAAHLATRIARRTSWRWLRA